MSGSGDSQKNQFLEQYWNAFFTDNFPQGIKSSNELIAAAQNEQDKEDANLLKARILLKQGVFEDAYDLVKDSKQYSGLKLFLKFLVDGDLDAVAHEYKDDTESQIFKAQSVIISRVYWGFDFHEDPSLDPDTILENVFAKLVEEEDFDRAILSYAQSIELMFKEKDLGRDLILPIAAEQINNLLELAEKAKYSSSKAKVFLLKAKLFKDKEAAEDAQILFGKENNQNGLGEVYTLLATDFKELEYYEKALDVFEKLDNYSAQGFIYESLASTALVKGAIQEAYELFDKAEDRISRGGLIEKVGLEIQKLSMLAVRGEFSILNDLLAEFISRDIPELFKAQAYQILATSLLQSSPTPDMSKEYIGKACEIFIKLKKYHQLLNAKNILFQILTLENDLDETLKLGEEIIQLADRLKRHDEKASKYVDLAFAIVRINVILGSLDAEKLKTSSDYFNKAIKLHKEHDNIVGEADVYQSMGNMFANIGKLEESYNCLNRAQELYKQEGAVLQSSISSILVGLLLGELATEHENSYKLAEENLKKALEYFQKEELYDFVWKVSFYIGELNERVYRHKKDDKFKHRAGKYYVEMFNAANNHVDNSGVNQLSFGSTTLEEALEQAADFFEDIGDEANATRFRGNSPT